MAPPITCTCGTCKKCKWREYMREWYRRGNNADRQCESQRESRARRLEYVREYDRRRGRRPGAPEKEYARGAVGRAILQGRLVRQPCEVCGAVQVDAHHDDYSKPLDVRWLCRRHHGVVHRTVSP